MKRMHPDMAEVIFRTARGGEVKAKEGARRLREDFGLNVSHKYLLALTDRPHANDAERPFKAELFFPFMAAFENWSALHVLNRIARDDYDVPADRQTARMVATKESAEAIAAINNPEASDQDRIKEIEEAIDALSAKLEAIKGKVD
ncbi:MAG: hypothetical protein KKC37_13050 [Proteobacteria bacterium]|nr:hypothetical protein [Pseudomonadota bacterium]